MNTALRWIMCGCWLRAPATESQHLPAVHVNLSSSVACAEFK